MWTAKTVKRPPQQPTQPQYANYWAPLTRKRHILPHPAQPRLRERGNDTSKSTGRSGRQNAATRRNMRRDERVTVQGPVKKQQPDGMSHRGGGGLIACRPCWTRPHPSVAGFICLSVIFILLCAYVFCAFFDFSPDGVAVDCFFS